MKVVQITLEAVGEVCFVCSSAKVTAPGSNLCAFCRDTISDAYDERINRNFNASATAASK